MWSHFKLQLYELMQKEFTGCLVNPRFLFIVEKVTWMEPSHGWVKLNTDGAAKSEPWTCRIGGIWRNSIGEVVGGFADHIGDFTNNVAKLKDILNGFKLSTVCRKHGRISG